MRSCAGCSRAARRARWVGARSALVHDAGRRAGRHERLAAAFPGCAVVVYGHSHVPEVARATGGLSSSTRGARRSGDASPSRSMAELQIRRGDVVARAVAPRPLTRTRVRSTMANTCSARRSSCSSSLSIAWAGFVHPSEATSRDATYVVQPGDTLWAIAGRALRRRRPRSRLARARRQRARLVGAAAGAAPASAVVAGARHPVGSDRRGEVDAADVDPFPVKSCRSRSHGKKITTRKASRSPVGSTPSHAPRCVAVTSASSHTPCGPMTMSRRSNVTSGNALRSSV